MGLWRRPAPSAADSLRPLLYGDQALDQWNSQAASRLGTSPWDLFRQAWELDRHGQYEEARAIWQGIADDPTVESRHALQAWQFLRDVGRTPPVELARSVLGCVAEVAVVGGHDLLVAYRSGGARYLNVSGRVAIAEPGASEALDSAVSAWIEVGRALAQVVGIWDQPALPKLPTGHSRIMMLTPGGKRFGQGPDELLRKDSTGAAFVGAATQLLLRITEHAL